MLLLTAATKQELDPILRTLADKNVDFLSLLTGVGLLDSAVSCTSFLASSSGTNINLVVNVGVTGAFVDTGVNLLDICLAKSEVVGDFGISLGDEIGGFDNFKPFSYSVDKKNLDTVTSLLRQNNISSVQGNFVSVNSVSATTDRGVFLRDRHQAICENMEGAAVARACLEYDIPFVEIRCVSNMVEDRDLSKWKMSESIDKLATVMGEILPAMISRNNS